ncbi:MAG: ATP-binding cassette domain-containing protein [Dysgonamonadaceae bacterium]|jgi:phospholipid/cholesterol/gamma-HCH transport system ATP-binding protein|nr:ATP-binding cassette domain-containing protein [Dysgonamonadaceae bacterium]
MIEVKNIIKSFEDKVRLKGVSTVFEAGKTNLIIGRSGSGKTVLLKNIIGLMKPDSGEILFDGRNIINMRKTELKLLRREMGMLFQGSALFDSMTVLENVMFPLVMFLNDTNRKRQERAKFCLERVNLSDAGDLYPSEISGGMMKRVAIARAIALNPKYLFCDEPNSGLDPKTSLLIDELIHDITVEYHITTVINTHDMNSVLNIGETIIFIKDGEEVWSGTKNDIMSSTNQDLNDFIFASDLFKKVKAADSYKQGELEASISHVDNGRHYYNI